MWRWDVGSAESGQALLNLGSQGTGHGVDEYRHFLDITINLDMPGDIRNLVCCWILEPHVTEG